MTTDIVNEIARLVAQREVGLKDPKETKELRSKKAPPEARDAVEFTDAAKAFAGHEAATDYENDQYMKVERLKALVGGGNYRIDREMVEGIAERIANMLV